MDTKQAVVNIGLIGHVDHGKTSITKMLSGKWTDTHSEEIKRGISIRLGFADTVFYKCGKCKTYTTEEKCKCGNKATALRRVSFVDAPGHETLMATMLSGATIMDGALLIIAANEECPQPRTKEHLMAVKMSGVKNVVVVQNKVDLVTKEKALENYNQIKTFLESLGYKDVPIIPVSANMGLNKSELIQAIEETIETPKHDDKANLYMCIVRSFDINKPGDDIENLIGGVLGGTILKGQIKVGDEIEISPVDGEKLVTKVVSLRTGKWELETARSGGLIAVGTELDPAMSYNDSLKGKVVGHVGELSKPVSQIELDVTSLERELMKFDKPIIVNEPLVLTIGTSTNLGIVSAITKNKVKINLKLKSIIEKGQNIAISRNFQNGWHLYGYGRSI